MRSACFRAITYQTVAMFIKCTHVQITTSPRIAYDRVLGYVYFCSSLINNSGVELAIISAGVQTKDEAVASELSFK